MSKFRDKIVFVTGAASGIGRGIVEHFAKEGARVTFCDINEELGQSVAEETGTTFYKADVSDEVALTATLVYNN